MQVRVGTRNMRLDRITFGKWFPSLAAASHWRNLVDTGPLAKQLKLRLTGHTIVPIRSHDIDEALKDMFKVLGEWELGYHWNAKDSRVKDMMTRFLKEQILSTDDRGLYRSRSRFLIFCAVAYCTQSIRLAAALCSFVNDKACRIAEYEEPFHLPEWYLGLCELRGLISEYELQVVMGRMRSVATGLTSERDDGLSYYGRGAPKPRLHARPWPPLLGLPGLPGWDPWAMRVPALGRFRSLDDVRVRRPGYFDDAEAIQYEQFAQAVQIEGVKQRIKQLEYWN